MQSIWLHLALKPLSDGRPVRLPHNFLLEMSADFLRSLERSLGGPFCRRHDGFIDDCFPPASLKAAAGALASFSAFTLLVGAEIVIDIDADDERDPFLFGGGGRHQNHKRRSSMWNNSGPGREFRSES
jgi:hypothetical protein